jgi:hypothetical protein
MKLSICLLAALGSVGLACAGPGPLSGKSSNVDREPAAVQGDKDVTIKTYGGDDLRLVQVIDHKRHLICYGFNAKSGAAMSCNPLKADQ